VASVVLLLAAAKNTDVMLQPLSVSKQPSFTVPYAEVITVPLLLPLTYRRSTRQKTLLSEFHCSMPVHLRLLIKVKSLLSIIVIVCQL